MKKYIILCISLTAIIFTACEDYLDINQDPTTPDPENVPAELILPSAELSIAGQIGGYYQIMGSIWSQFYAQANASNQYKEIDAFDINPDFMENHYNELYSGALNDLRAIKQLSRTDEEWDVFLMATVLEAYTYQVLADLYGEIPFTEALRGDEGMFNPNFESGEIVYDSLIARIDYALSQDFPSQSSIGTDLLFDGDMEQWRAFANTLKLKMFLREAYVNPGEAEQNVSGLVNSGVQFLATDAAITQFTDEDSRSNPLFESDRRKLNTPNNLRASYTMASFLIENNDPRLEVFFEEPVVGGEITAIPQGSFDVSSAEIEPTTISRARIEATDAVYFITESESYFLQAEAAVRYGLGDAEVLYNQGVTVAFARFDLDASAFIADGGAYDFPESGSDEEQIKAIIMQKWVSQVRGNALEAYFDFLRTGYPEISDVAAVDVVDSETYVPGEFIYPRFGVTSGNFPQRLLYPDLEVSRNPNTPDQKDINTPVWWNNN